MSNPAASASAPGTPVPIPLSVLDTVPVAAGSDVGAALRNMLDLARRVERLGYSRYWLAEHHNMPAIASSAPAVLIGQVAAATSTLRVGSGGVMLPNHAPLVVAEQFGTLAALYPDRIDLGLGRAPGTDPVTARALRRSADPLSAEDFPLQLQELLGYFDAPAENPGRVGAVAAAGNRPPVWLLGSSDYSARLAGLLGLPFAFAHHFSSSNTVPAVHIYRQMFRPSAELDRPHVLIAANALCADTDEQAEELAAPAGLFFLRLRRNQLGRYPSPEEAAAYPYTPLEREFIQERQAGQLIGSPTTVRRQMDELIARTGADELMLTTVTYDHADRVRSFELVARAAGLAAPGADEGADAEADDGVAAGRRLPA